MRTRAHRDNVTIDVLTELANIIVSDKTIGKGRFETWKRRVAIGRENLVKDIWTMKRSVRETRTAKWSKIIRDDTTSSGNAKIWWRSMFLDQPLDFVALDRRSGRRPLDR